MGSKYVPKIKDIKADNRYHSKQARQAPVRKVMPVKAPKKTAS